MIMRPDFVIRVFSSKFNIEAYIEILIFSVRVDSDFWI